MMSLRCAPRKSLWGPPSIVVMLAGLLFSVGLVSPISAKKYPPLEKQLTSPTRLALTNQGDLLVSDYQNQSVLIVDPSNLSVKHKINIKGHPVGVNGYGSSIYVGNETTGNIEVYSQKGKLKSSLGNGGIGLPNDIAVDNNSGKFFVVDAKAKHVRIFDPQGLDIGIIPADGVAELLAFPTALVLDQENQLVLVSDQGPSIDAISFSNRNARVRIYRYNGTYVDTLSGAFTRPQGLTLNSAGYLYLADGLRGQILVFDLLSKSLVRTIGNPGIGDGELSLPLDVLITPDTEDLLVANNRAGRLELFVGGGVTP